MKAEQLIAHGRRDAEDYEQRLDHLVDTMGYSYDDARRQLGEPPYEMYSPAQVERGLPIGRCASQRVVRPRRRRSGHGPQYGEEEGVGYLHNEPPYYQKWEPLNDDQAALNREWIERIRQRDAETAQDDELAESKDGDDTPS